MPKLNFNDSLRRMRCGIVRSGLRGALTLNAAAVGACSGVV